jgi:hypothetical protein
MELCYGYTKENATVLFTLVSFGSEGDEKDICCDAISSETLYDKNK